MKQRWRRTPNIVCTHTRTHACTHTYTHASMNTCMHTHTNPHPPPPHPPCPEQKFRTLLAACKHNTLTGLSRQGSRISSTILAWGVMWLWASQCWWHAYFPQRLVKLLYLSACIGAHRTWASTAMNTAPLRLTACVLLSQQISQLASKFFHSKCVSHSMKECNHYIVVTDSVISDSYQSIQLAASLLGLRK